MRFHKDQEYCFYRYNRDLEANWKVLLNNGEIIYQDDAGSSWANLHDYCKDKGVWPIHMTLEYYDNVLNILPPNAEGYFYRQGILTEMMCFAAGGNAPFQGKRSKTAIIGYAKDGGVYTTTVRLPELIVWDSEFRGPEKLITDGILNDKSLLLVKSCITANTPTAK